MGDDGGVKWARAVHHVESLAQSCASMNSRPASIFPLRVTQLWVAGEILGEPCDLESVSVALAVDLPVEEVPWLGEPVGARHWGNATRLAQNPLQVWWRSAHAPVWNHRIVQPALVWDAGQGVRGETLAELSAGRGADVRSPAPSAEQLRFRMAEEFSVSLRELRARTDLYEQRRWSPGKLEPLADALWRASDGYLDLLDAAGGVPAR
jgi:hypothetical protein